ncbi:HlyD family type I secretion periplasmic adaptor subunit [Thalassospira mesophila]|uniref:HlyD family type I secretion periplasmic adaptor subunit n=1 Tax=Thalassospira mesophila TaxID=1293891 RepID=UPI0013022CB4|nr:HlyD family type I secretion periplasmic adaptor subunit [Thalassospira mesophila]
MISTFSLFVILGSIITWSAFMPITEISASSGEVVPSGALQTVQHLEGGIVSNIHVREGQYVNKDDIVVELSPHIAQSELDQLQTRLMGLQFRIRFLTAARGDNLPEIKDFDPAYEDIARAAQYELSTKRETVASQVEVFNQQVKEREAQLATLKSQASGISDQIRLKNVQVKGRRTLVEKGLFPRMDLIEDERELASLVDSRAALVLEASRTGESIGEIRQRVVETMARYHSEIAAELSQLASEAAEVRVAIVRARDRVDRLLVRAPVSGRVKGLEVKTIGGVIEPGATMMEIVPDNTELQVEARISTQDIGHVHVGQAANVKVLTYDYSRFGTIPAKISQISPTTFIDEDGVPFYKADLILESAHVGDNTDLTITPGMTVIADILTGEKTLLAAIMSPVVKSFDSAFRER